MLTKFKENDQSRLVWLLVILWVVVNLVQSASVGAHEDEAYYWMWSRFLDWGYFDHPPMVAVMIDAGRNLFSGTLGMRFFTALLSGVSLWLMWDLVKEYKVSAKAFFLLALSIPLIQIYGFVTTPDVPLFFFGVLYFHALKRYYANDNIKNSVLLALVIALMFYSKYHAVLFVFFSLLSNLKLLKKPSFWATAVLAVVFLLPHIIWQFSHDFPSIQYHLFDRSKRPYRLDYTTMYVLNQWIVLGPLTAFFVFKGISKMTFKSYFDKALLFNLVGIIIFFFLSSFKGWVEPHWTLIASIPLVILGARGLSNLSEKLYQWFERLAIATIVLLGLARIIIAVPGPWSTIPALKMFYPRTQWAATIKEAAQGRPVLFMNGFQAPSKYGFYSDGAPVACLTQVEYRKHQYDLWPNLDSLQGRSVLLVGWKGQLKNMKHFDTDFGTLDLGVIDDFQSLGKIHTQILNPKKSYKPNEVVNFEVLLSNNFNRAVQFHQDINGDEPALAATIWKDGEVYNKNFEKTPLQKLNWQVTEQTEQQVTVKLPSEVGKYKLMISTVQAPFNRRINGRSIDFEIK